MALAPNPQNPLSTTPLYGNPVQYPQYFEAVGPAVLPSAAKTVLTDATNVIWVLPGMANNTQEIDYLAVEVTATLSAGKLLAFLININAAAFQIGSVAHAAITVSTTAAASPIAFAFSAANPLIVPPGFSLFLATAVAQPAGSLIATGWGRVY